MALLRPLHEEFDCQGNVGTMFGREDLPVLGQSANKWLTGTMDRIGGDFKSAHVADLSLTQA
jgi:hypothetical protein